MVTKKVKTLNWGKQSFLSYKEENLIFLFQRYTIFSELISCHYFDLLYTQVDDYRQEKKLCCVQKKDKTKQVTIVTRICLATIRSFY